MNTNGTRGVDDPLAADGYMDAEHLTGFAPVTQLPPQPTAPAAQAPQTPIVQQPTQPVEPVQPAAQPIQAQSPQPSAALDQETDNDRLSVASAWPGRTPPQAARPHARSEYVPPGARTASPAAGGTDRPIAPGATTLWGEVKSKKKILIPIAAVLCVAALVLMFGGGGGSAPEAGDAGTMTAVAFQGAAVPVSSEAGPTSIDDVRASGFGCAGAPCELGAALAALHLSVRTDPHTGPAVFGPAISEQTSGATDQLLQLRQKQYEQLAAAATVTGGAPVISPTGQMVGWKIDSWSDDGPVLVHLLVRVPGSKELVDYGVSVQWDSSAGDYQMVATADGAFPVTKVTDDSPYTAFMPQGASK